MTDKLWILDKKYEHFIPVTERDLKDLGWVKAEPTDCCKCKDWYDGECHHFNHAIEGINSEIDDINNEICLDFKPKEGDKK